MPITSSVKGDLLSLAKEGRYDVIVHGCNCFNTMGAGIALQVANQYPEAVLVDKRTLRGDVRKLGKYTHYETKEGFTVVNMYTQYNYRRSDLHNVRYDAVARGFHRLNKKYAGKKVGIPLIGAGLAGGHWEAIKVIINLVTPDLEIELVEYVYD